MRRQRRLMSRKRVCAIMVYPVIFRVENVTEGNARLFDKGARAVAKERTYGVGAIANHGYCGFLWRRDKSVEQCPALPIQGFQNGV